MDNKLLDKVWYHIPGFNGYVINTEGRIKSMKNFRKYPGGLYIKYTSRKDGSGYYVLSDDKNARQKRSKEELLDLVANSPSLYTLDDDKTYIGSRNKGYMNNNNKYPNGEGTVTIDITSDSGPMIIPKKEEKPFKIDFGFDFSKGKNEEEEEDRFEIPTTSGWENFNQRLDK